MTGAAVAGSWTGRLWDLCDGWDQWDVWGWQTSLRDGARGAQVRGLKAPATVKHRSAMGEAVASSTE